MNRQPFTTPPRRWDQCLTPWWVRLSRPLRMDVLRRQQKFQKIEMVGAGPLRQLLKENAGVLITPNHSFHYDSYVLFEAAHKLGTPFHFMVAWQVFAMVSKWEQWSLQRHGCFSIDRESNDMPAFRQAVQLLQSSPYPLVIFPEGEIYHTNDRVTPFREGAAAIALTAARKAKRDIYCVPCAMKCWYLRNPTHVLLRVMDKLERRLLWRPRHDRPLNQRVYDLAEGILSLKELEYLKKTRSRTIPERRNYLANAILKELEQNYRVKVNEHTIPERVKELRRAIIQQQDKTDQDDNDRARGLSQLEDLFFVIQLFSYPGDYIAERWTVERLAETIDKFEEDLLERSIPTVKGSRRVVVKFGEPILLAKERGKRNAASQLTEQLQSSVQAMLDKMNANHIQKG